MIHDRVIVCVANSWDYDPTCKHHIMSVLGRHNDIVWINYHGTRRPSATRADLWAIGLTLRRVAGGIKRVGPRFIQTTPLVIPGASHPLLSSLSRRLLKTQIRRAIRHVEGAANKPLQVWAFAPDVPYLIGSFKEECFVYYCTDEFSRFKDLSAARVTATENELLDRADVVFVTSETLLRNKERRRADVVLARHGVEFDLFAAAWQNPPVLPEDVACFDGPIFGFFGLIHHWIDVALLAEVARLRPTYSFVFLGEWKVDVSSLRRLPNVYLLGRKRHGELPAYCAAFDAGLLPFLRDELAPSINPIKMYEYLAAGLPIVSTPLPEAERFAGPIRFASTPRAFAERCDEVLATARPGRREAISRTVESESWAAKVELLSDVVLNRIKRPGNGTIDIRETEGKAVVDPDLVAT